MSDTILSMLASTLGHTYSVINVGRATSAPCKQQLIPWEKYFAPGDTHVLSFDERSYIIPNSVNSRVERARDHGAARLTLSLSSAGEVRSMVAPTFVKHLDVAADFAIKGQYASALRLFDSYGTHLLRTIVITRRGVPGKGIEIKGNIDSGEMTLQISDADTVFIGLWELCSKPVCAQALHSAYQLYNKQAGDLPSYNEKERRARAPEDIRQFGMTTFFSHHSSAYVANYPYASNGAYTTGPSCPPNEKTESTRPRRGDVPNDISNDNTPRVFTQPPVNMWNWSHVPYKTWN